MEAINRTYTCLRLGVDVVYEKLLLCGSKQYVGWVREGESLRQITKGVSLIRRDECALVKYMSAFVLEAMAKRGSREAVNAIRRECIRVSGMLANDGVPAAGLEPDMFVTSTPAVAPNIRENDYKIAAQDTPEAILRRYGINGPLDVITRQFLTIRTNLGKPLSQYRLLNFHVEAGKRLEALGTVLEAGDTVPWLVVPGPEDVRLRAHPEVEVGSVSELDTHFYRREISRALWTLVAPWREISRESLETWLGLRIPHARVEPRRVVRAIEVKCPSCNGRHLLRTPLASRLTCERTRLRLPWQVIANRAFDAIRNAIAPAHPCDDAGLRAWPKATLHALRDFEAALGQLEDDGSDAALLRKAVVRYLGKAKEAHVMATFSFSDMYGDDPDEV
jgi:hypothetical protein